ncbi:hypothetical protein TcWFU_004349 [Taenia crassiceps]|uniref:Uncharacterized protein n=1 Tax=Taenia crassiceps TaxID=6207 RepID=A0ABR4Q2A9_9CEST
MSEQKPWTAQSHQGFSDCEFDPEQVCLMGWCTQRATDGMLQVQAPKRLPCCLASITRPNRPSVICEFSHKASTLPIFATSNDAQKKSGRSVGAAVNKSSIPAAPLGDRGHPFDLALLCTTNVTMSGSSGVNWLA